MAKNLAAIPGIKKKDPTNVDLVVASMEFSNYGPLAQMFIIEAIRKYSDACSESKIPDGGFVSPESWMGVAKEIKGKFDAFYS